MSIQIKVGSSLHALCKVLIYFRLCALCAHKPRRNMQIILYIYLSEERLES